MWKLRVLDELAGVEIATASACDDEGHIHMAVIIPLGELVDPYDDGVVEHGAFAFRDGIKLGEQVVHLGGIPGVA